MPFDFSKIAEDLDKPAQEQRIRIMTKEEIAKRYNDGERDFSGAVSPSSDFSGLNLSGVILRRAKLGNSSFKNCDLSGADLSFAELQDTNFENTNLQNANFSDATAFNSVFKGAKIGGAKFIAANISECNFEGCDKASADFSDALMKPAFSGRKMTAAEVIREYKQGVRDFSGVSAPNSDFSGQKLSGIILRKANLHYSSFNHTDLTGADLSGADLTSCAFDNTILRNANLSKANMYWSRISGAVMEGANLKETNLSWCDISGTDFSGCDISKANVQWSLALRTKFSGEQFFALNPEILATLKLSHLNAESTEARRTASASTGSSYLAVNSGVGEYMRKGKNISVYTEIPSEIIGAYSPNGKKEAGGYRN